MSDIRPTDEQIRAGWEALEDSRSLTANREHHEFLDAIEAAMYPLPKPRYEVMEDGDIWDNRERCWWNQRHPLVPPQATKICAILNESTP